MFRVCVLYSLVFSFLFFPFEVKSGLEISAKPDEVAYDFVGNYLSGDYALRNNNPESAAKIFLKALEHDPNNLLLLQRAYKMLLSLGKVEQSIEVVRHYIDYTKMDSDAGVLLAVYEASLSNFGKSEIILDSILDDKNKMLSSRVNKVIVPFLKLWSKVGQKKYTDVESYSKNILGKEKPPSLFLSYQMALISDIKGDFSKAEKGFIAISNGSLASAPYHFINASGNFYERKGEMDKARALYKNYNKYASQLGRFVYKLKSDRARAQKHVVPSAKEGYSEVLKEAARVLYSSGYYSEGLTYLRMAMFLHEDDDESRVMLAKYYEKTDRLKKSIRVYKLMDSESDFYLTSQVNIADNLYILGKKDRAVSQLNEIAEEFPESNIALLTLADLLRKEKDYAGAVKVYSRIIDRISSLELRNWPILFARGICHERAGDWEASERDLQQALALKPGQAEVLNYLGYSWIDRGVNVKEARAMVEAAVRERPYDAQIVDSMGWVLYKVKDFAGAANFLERAAEITPYDAVINDHLGDTYWRMGRSNEAIFQWQRVLKYNNSDDIVVSVIEGKIKNGLPAVVEM